MHNLLYLILHYVLPFIIGISVIVFVHEFGHYWVARRCGIRVLAFSIGFGTEIFGWNDSHGTRWKVCWLPMGGYVKMFGDANPASTPDATVHQMTDAEKQVAFYHQHVDKRIAVVIAGPLFNYLFAILVLALLFMFQGQPYSPADVGTVLDHSAAAKAGLMSGDHIVALDNATIDRFEDIQRIVGLNAGTPIPIDVMRNGALLHMTVTPEIVSMTDRFGGEHKIGRIGISKITGQADYKKWPPLMAIKQAVLETWNLTTGTLKAIGQMIMGTRGTEELGGPLRVAEIFGHAASDGVITMIWTMALISINLGLVNLFPVPLLDGGHIVFYIYERFRGKPLSEVWQETGTRVGMVMVLSLMLFATWNDLGHLKVISYLRGLFS